MIPSIEFSDDWQTHGPDADGHRWFVAIPPGSYNAADDELTVKVLSPDSVANTPMVDMVVAGITDFSSRLEVDAAILAAIYAQKAGLVPAKASVPSPTHLAVAVDVDADLSWINGARANSINIYFGITQPPPLVSGPLMSLVTAFEPGTLQAATQYFWRIDTINGMGGAPGTEWSFTTA